MEISNSVVIITGASDGLGEAMACLFASRGARVALTARSADKLNRLATELPGSFAVPADMSDKNSIAQMVAGVHAHYGRIDLLINNAGQGMHGFVEHVDVGQYRTLMDLNLYGPLLAMQAVIPLMRAQGGGMILNISSPLSKMPLHIPGLGVYESTKAALNLITLTARAELGADNIRVGVIYPSMMATAFGAHLLPARTTRRAIEEGTSGGPPPGAPLPQPPEAVANRILDAVQQEPAELYTNEEYANFTG